MEAILTVPESAVRSHNQLLHFVPTNVHAAQSKPIVISRMMSITLRCANIPLCTTSLDEESSYTLVERVLRIWGVNWTAVFRTKKRSQLGGLFNLTRGYVNVISAHTAESLKHQQHAVAMRERWDTHQRCAEHWRPAYYRSIDSKRAEEHSPLPTAETANWATREANGSEVKP